MSKYYLLDTNAYFNLLKCLRSGNVSPEVSTLKQARCYISEITAIEIVSVIGKYARGQCAQKQTCDRIISETGDRCKHQWHQAKRDKMPAKQVKDWLKYIDAIQKNNSPYLALNILPITPDVLRNAQSFITYSTRYNFASHDSIIAGTLMAFSDENKSLEMVTSDKGFKAGLALNGISVFDVFNPEPSSVLV